MNITSLATAVKNALAGLLPTSLGSKTTANSLAVTLPSDLSMLPVGGATVTASVTRTRPADTTGYSIGDAVTDSSSASTAIVFTNMARVNAGTGYITKALLKSNLSTMVAVFRLHLYSATPTLVNDNNLFTEMWADAPNYLGFIDFESTTTENGASDSCKSLNKDVRLAFNCAAGTTSIFGVLQTKTAFTPTSGQLFTIKLTSEQN